MLIVVPSTSLKKNYWTKWYFIEIYVTTIKNIYLGLSTQDGVIPLSFKRDLSFTIDSLEQVSLKQRTKNARNDDV